jgi:RNA polymerase sigma-70 factor, ECF subfamily
MDNQNMFFECETKITKRIASKVNDSMDIEDLRQEVFIRYKKGLENIKNTDNLCGYLLRITDNIVHDYYRNKFKIPSESFNPTLQYENSEQNIVEDGYSLSEISVITFLNKLSEKYKEALILTEINGESQKNVAEKLNLTYSALKSRVQRARKMLKAEILNCCDYKFDTYGNIISCCENNPCC